MIITAHDTPIIAGACKRGPHNKLSHEERESRRALAKAASKVTPSQRQLARTLGMAQPDVCKCLSGKRPVPKRCLPILERIVEAAA